LKKTCDSFEDQIAKLQENKVMDEILSHMYEQLQSINDSPQTEFSLENFQQEMNQCLDKFRKLGEVVESSLKSAETKKDDDLLLNQIEDLTSRLQFTESQIEHIQRDQNILLEDKRIIQSKLDNQTETVENLKTILDRKISFEK
jgi:hypothetical protein